MDFIDIDNEEIDAEIFARNIPFVGDSNLGEGMVVQFYQCVECYVDNICILYTSKALKWGKVLMKIFADPRGTWFLAHTWQIVHWCGYGYARMWQIVFWCGYSYSVW